MWIQLKTLTICKNNITNYLRTEKQFIYLLYQSILSFGRNCSFFNENHFNNDYLVKDRCLCSLIFQWRQWFKIWKCFKEIWDWKLLFYVCAPFTGRKIVWLFLKGLTGKPVDKVQSFLKKETIPRHNCQNVQIFFIKTKSHKNWY